VELVKHSDIMHLTGFLAVQPDSDMKVNVLVIIQAVKREPVSIPHKHTFGYEGSQADALFAKKVGR